MFTTPLPISCTHLAPNRTHLASAINNLLRPAVDYTYLLSIMPSSTSADPGSLGWKKIRYGSIWGDEPGLQVFSEAFNLHGRRGPATRDLAEVRSPNQAILDTEVGELRIIFRFSTDPTARQCIQSRIVTCYHGHPAEDLNETFLDRGVMRDAVEASIAQVWDCCSNHPCIRMPDVVVEIYNDEHGRCQWRLAHLSVYGDYLQQLLPLAQVLYEEVPLDTYETFDTIDISSLSYHGGFRSRGDDKLVRLQSKPDSLFVFRGVDFAAYLKVGSAFYLWRFDCYHEIRTIRSLLPHPNIVAPATTFVTATEISEKPRQAFICGTLSPYMYNGTLNDQVKEARDTESPLLLAEKGKWCFQMVSAIAHTHHLCETYHNDIKPSNFLIDDNRDLILIDWAQSGASRCTIAPEADGSYDVEAQPDSPTDKRLYKKYEDPERENQPCFWPYRDVFPVWRVECPEALEAAEVFSLGRTMWMLLEEVDEGSPDDGMVTTHWKKWGDIPDEWKAIVGRCLESDPNKRVGLLELVGLWLEARNCM